MPGLTTMSVLQWRFVAQRLMRSLCIVFDDPVFGYLPYLFKTAEQIQVQHLVSVSFVKSFNETILSRLARHDIIDLNIMFSGPADKVM